MTQANRAARLRFRFALSLALKLFTILSAATIAHNRNGNMRFK